MAGEISRNRLGYFVSASKSKGLFTCLSVLFWTVFTDTKRLSVFIAIKCKFIPKNPADSLSLTANLVVIFSLEN